MYPSQDDASPNQDADRDCGNDAASGCELIVHGFTSSIDAANSKALR
jgi:hypothetical protein